MAPYITLVIILAHHNRLRKSYTRKTQSTYRVQF